MGQRSKAYEKGMEKYYRDDRYVTKTIYIWTVFKASPRAAVYRRIIMTFAEL